MIYLYIYYEKNKKIYSNIIYLSNLLITHCISLMIYYYINLMKNQIMNIKYLINIY